MVAAASNAHPWFIQGLLHLHSTVSAATEELGTAGPLESKALSHDMRKGHVTGGPADQSREVSKPPWIREHSTQCCAVSRAALRNMWNVDS